MKKIAVSTGVVLLGLAIALVASHRESARNKPQGRRVLYYVDPMHPAYKSDRPGTAPDCGMALEPVYADSPETDSLAQTTAMLAGSIHLNEQQQQLVGVRLVSAEQEENGSRDAHLLGRVSADEQRVYRINAAVDGWLTELRENSAGSRVRHNQLLARYFSPDLLTAGQSYVVAMEYLRKNGTPDLNRFGRPESLANQLRNLGVPDVQLDEIAATQVPPRDIHIVSPIDGFILSRSISPQQRFSRGTELYRIADLRRVWILADIYPNEQNSFRPGMVARVTVRGNTTSVHAQISDILPQFDPASGSLKLRLEADNPEFVLRPDMFVDIILPVRVPRGLTVPTDTLLDSGVKKIVFVHRGGGNFEPRVVETGWQSAGRIQITSGLQAGEQVVAAGNFLLDSESRIKNVSYITVTTAEDSQENAQAEDPMCGMKVDRKPAETSGFVVTYNSQTYYFCSRGCKEQFERTHGKMLAADQSRSHD